MGRPKRNPTLPNSAGEKILRALGTYRYLTAEQATRAIGHSGNSLKGVYGALKNLTDNHYTVIVWMPKRTGRGITSNLAVWTLLGKGRRWLADRGVDHPPKVSQSPEREILFLEHALAVNDVLIAFERFAVCSEGQVTIHTLTPDHALKHQPITVELEGGRKSVIVPDGYVQMTAYGYEYTFWLELDRGTEDRRRWKSKVDSIVRYAQTLGEVPLTVMVVTTSAPPRLSHLWEWTGQQLETMGRPQ